MAKKSIVGINVTVGFGVGVSGIVVAVGVANNAAISGKPPEQLERIIPINIRGTIFFIAEPFRINV